MINYVKTIISGLFLGAMLYVYYFYAEGFLIQLTLLVGLLILGGSFKDPATLNIKAKEEKMISNLHLKLNKNRCRK